MRPASAHAAAVESDLLFRIRSKKSSKPEILDFGALQIDRVSYTVSVNGQRVDLPKKEFELLYFLAQHPNQVFSREDLLQNIWGSDVYVLARTVDVHVRKVREKIGEDYISTVKGVGYKFNEI